MDIAQALQAAYALGLARLDAQLLLLHVLGRAPEGRAWLIAHDGDALPLHAQKAYLDLCRRRSAGEPVAYLTGSKEFHGLALAVDARVLVPRPDTETLVHWSLDVLSGQVLPTVLDLGTGSGAIALAIRRARPDAQVSAVDASAAALAVARANGEKLGLPVQWLHGHWFAPVHGRFGLIASNPPYIAEGDPHLAALAHEPRSALTSGPDGLDDLRHIVQHAPEHLADGGWLLLEHGYDQAEAVRCLLAARGFQAVQSRNDLAGIARCSGGLWPGRG